MTNAALLENEFYNTPYVNQENQNPKLSVLLRDNAFTQTDLVSTRDARTQELIHQIRKSSFEFYNTPSVNQENQNPKLAAFRPDNAFTQSDLVSTKDDQAQELIHQIRKSTLVSNQENLANQLVTLFKFAKEESPARPAISVNSLSSFYDFIKLYANTIKTPSLSLSPDHNIYASWRGDNRIFSAHFLPDGDISFVLFKPNNRHPQRKIRISGTATGDTLTEIVAPESLSDWVLG